MEDINLFQVVSQVFPLIGAQNPQGEADKRPEVNHTVPGSVMLAQLMNLGMTVVAAGNTVIGAGGLDLIVLQAPILQASFLVSGLKESTAAPAAEIIGSVGVHVDKVVFANHRFDHETKILGDGIAITFTYDLARVLYGELDLEVFVPVRVYLELAFTDPLRVVLIDVLYFKFVRNIVFFQSCQD